jgi:hypothetical protein
MSSAWGREGEAGQTNSSGDAAPAGGGPLGDEAITALQTALAAEHAALWAYGLVAAYDTEAAATVATMIISHQSTRDTAANLIVQGGATPVGPQPAYTSPKPVTDAASALALALTIESDCADAWRAAIGSTDDSTLRGTALSALTDAAMRMVTWRTAAKEATVTVPFPGDPQTS